MNKPPSIDGMNDDFASERGVQLRSKLKRESNISLRQELLKELWQLSQPPKGLGAEACRSSHREPDAIREMRKTQSHEVDVPCCSS